MNTLNMSKNSNHIRFLEEVKLKKNQGKNTFKNLKTRFIKKLARNYLLCRHKPLM